MSIWHTKNINIVPNRQIEHMGQFKWPKSIVQIPLVMLQKWPMRSKIILSLARCANTLTKLVHRFSKRKWEPNDGGWFRSCYCGSIRERSPLKIGFGGPIFVLRCFLCVLLSRRMFPWVSLLTFSRLVVLVRGLALWLSVSLSLSLCVHQTWEKGHSQQLVKEGQTAHTSSSHIDDACKVEKPTSQGPWEDKHMMKWSWNS